MAELRVGGNLGEMAYQENSLKNISLMEFEQSKALINSSGDQTPTWLLEGKICFPLQASCSFSTNLLSFTGKSESQTALLQNATYRSI